MNNTRSKVIFTSKPCARVLLASLFLVQFMLSPGAVSSVWSNANVAEALPGQEPQKVKESHRAAQVQVSAAGYDLTVFINGVKRKTIEAAQPHANRAWAWVVPEGLPVGENRIRLDVTQRSSSGPYLVVVSVRVGEKSPRERVFTWKEQHLAAC